MENQNIIESGEKRAKVAIIFILLTVASYALYSVLVKAVGDWVDAEGYEYTESWTMNHTLLAFLFLVSIGMALSSIISIVTFIMWFWKSYDNLEKLGSWMLSSKYVTMWCWFIPFANLYLPYKYMYEMFEAANVMIRDKDELLNLRAPTNMVRWWWILSLSFMLIYGIAIYLPALITLLGNYGIGWILVVLVLCLIVILAVVTVRMIRSYVAVEEKLIELYSAENNEKNEN